MAVTSIWAVHRSIKDALDYAANPEKTENPNEEDLKRLMDYAENPDKTEQRYLISGVNCLPELAYERMMETKRRYGKYGGIVAYHGYMSFKPGEVTPEQCHALGVELAKRLWGDKYEVLVASHRDHEHLHNHFILNSVSFKDGEKFHCPPYYHDTVMAPESDKLCLEHDLSVIQNPQRKRSPYVAYMAEKKGKPSHRTLLKMDIDDAIADCMLPSHFQFALTRRGYTYLRGKEYKHPCVIAKGWQRPVRIDNLGARYTPEAIEKRILSRREHRTPYYPSCPPLYEIWQRHKGYDQHNTIEFIFMIVLELFGIDTSGKVIQNDNYQEPLSPAMRQEQIYLDRYMQTVNLINRNDLGTAERVQEFIDDIRDTEIAALELINTDKVSDQSKQCYITRLSTKISDICSIQDKKMWKHCMGESVIVSREQNAFEYYAYVKSIDEALLQFINEFDSEFVFESITGSDNQNELIEKFAIALISNNKIDNNRYKQLVNSLARTYEIFEITGIDPNKVNLIIDAGIIIMNAKNLHFIRDNYPGHTMKFVRQNIDEYVKIMDTSLFVFDELIEILGWDIEDELKLTLLDFTDTPISIIDKDYPVAVKLHALKHNRHSADIRWLYQHYNTQPAEIKEYIYPIASESINIILGNEYALCRELYSLLIKDASINLQSRVELFLTRLKQYDKQSALAELKNIGITEFQTIFEENKRPRFTINEVNKAILDAFVEQNWIAGYEEDEKRQGYYKIKKRSDKEKTEEVALL